MTSTKQALLALTALLALAPPAPAAAQVPRQAGPTAPAPLPTPSTQVPGRPTPSGSLVLTEQPPGSPLDLAARQYAAADIAAIRQRGEVPLVLAASVQLGGPRDPAAVFVQLQSPRECGSAGCSTSAYLRGRRVLDAVSGQVRVDAQRHRGMRDLLVGEGARYAWNGTAYADTGPAPSVNLRPRRPPR